MKITKLWNTADIYKECERAIKLTQMSRINEQITTIRRKLTRVDIALDTLEGEAVAEAKEYTTKMLKLLTAAKQSESSMMTRINLERFKEMI